MSWLARGAAVVGGLALEWVSRIRSATRSAAAPGAAGAGGRAGARAAERTRGRTVQTLAQLPLRFEANTGQFDDGVRFAARGVGYGVALTPTGATLGLTSSTADTGRGGDDRRRTRRRSRRGPRASTAASRCPASSTTSSAPTGALADGVGQFARVRQAGVYDGIDLEFYGNQQRLEYDFLVAPGADPAPSASASTAPSGSKWTAAAICWCTWPAASRCASRRRSAIR